MSDDALEAVKECEHLEALAESDLESAWAARVLLESAKKNGGGE